MRYLKSNLIYLLALFCTVVFLPACKDDYSERFDQINERDEKAIQQYITDNNIQNAQRQSSGVYYIPQVAGNGTPIKRGNTVKAHYIIRDIYGQKQESTYDSGQPASFLVGSSNNLTGLNEGLLLMQNGEKAIIIIPALMGYGQYSSVTVYELTILEVK